MCSVCVQQLLILSVCTRCVYVPACWSLLRGFILIFNQKKRMIAFQWVEGRLHYVTTQHFCLCNILNFNGGFRRHRLFSRFSALCPRTEQDPLSCGHHCHDSDGFFLLSWYWPFLIAIGEVAAERMCSMQPALDPRRGTCNTQCQLNPNLWHTLWPQINVFRHLSAFKYNLRYFWFTWVFLLYVLLHCRYLVVSYLCCRFYTRISWVQKTWCIF